jgi:hypothetical protein
VRRSPRHCGSPRISAAADDRTFVLLQSPETSLHDLVWCFLLRVAANGRSVKVTRLRVSIPASMVIDNAALSPDGTRLAMSAQWSCRTNRCADAGIRVADLATGKATTWTTRVNGAPSNVSWAGYRLAGRGGDRLRSRCLRHPGRQGCHHLRGQERSYLDGAD